MLGISARQLQNLNDKHIYDTNNSIYCHHLRFTDEDVDEMYREAPIKNGMFDYTEFTRILKHGAKEKDEA